MELPTVDEFSEMESIEELSDNCAALKAQIVKLTKENEYHKQQHYTLHCKLELSAAMQEEMRESQEILEKTANELDEMMKKKVQELEEKHTEEKHDLFSRLSELETENAKKCEQIESLQLKIQELNKKLQSTSVEAPMVILDETENQEKIDELLSQIELRDCEHEKLGKCIQDLNTEIAEMKEILATTKSELSEKKEQLETARDEVMSLKMELAEAKEKPASESSRGNSLFAEVEDRRKKMLDQNAALKKGYIEAKRIVNSKDAEIRLLKTEKAELMRRWEDDKADTNYRDLKLMETYKERITELEEKLAHHIEKMNKMRNEMQPTGDPYSFFTSMMNLKEKEIGELQGKLEFNSIQAVVQEETTNRLSRQSKYWRRKAYSAEAQLAAIKSHLEANPNAANSEEVLQILNRPVEIKPDFQEQLDATRPPPDIVEESVMTIEQLMVNPCSSKGATSEPLNTSMFNSFDENSKSTLLEASCTELSNPKSSKTTETITVQSALKKGENRRRSVQEIKELWESDAIAGEKIAEFKTPQSHNLEQEDRCSVGEKSSFAAEVSKNEKKTLKFSEDTLDTPTKTMKRQNTPRYITKTNEASSNKENCSNGQEASNSSNLKSALAQSSGKFTLSTDEPKKEKKTLKFTEDTVDPGPKTLKRQATPKYPIVFVSNKPKK